MKSPEGFFETGWRRKLESLRTDQHIDMVKGVRWSESYRTHFNSVRRRVMQRHGSAKSRRATLCVITEPFTTADDQFDLDTFNSAVKRLETAIGTNCREGQTVDDKVDLFFDGIPIDRLKPLCDRLNDEDESVQLAHFRDTSGRLYPA